SKCADAAKPWTAQRGSHLRVRYDVDGIAACIDERGQCLVNGCDRHDGHRARAVDSAFEVCFARRLGVAFCASRYEEEIGAGGARRDGLLADAADFTDRA